MNKVFLAGRLATDPQQFVTTNGITQSRVSIACTDNWNKNESYFFPCVAWQSVANFINTYLKKGDPVVVDGKLIRRSYVSKEGKTVYITEVVIETIRLFGSRPSGNYINDAPNGNVNSYNYNKSNSYKNNNTNPNSTSNSNDLEFKDNYMSSNDDLIEDSGLDLEKIEENKNQKTDDNSAPNVESDEIVDLDWMNDIK